MKNKYNYSLYAYSRNKPKKTKFGFKQNQIILLACIIVAAILIIIFATSFANKSAIFMEQKTYYSVALAVFSDEARAQAFAEGVKIRGAGGYIHFQSDYKVLASVYITKQDADSVIKKTEVEFNAVCYKIVVPKTAIAFAATRAEIESFREKIIIYESVFLELNTMSQDIDAKRIGISDASIKINTIISEVNEGISELNPLLENAKDSLIESDIGLLKTNLLKLKTTLSTLVSFDFNSQSLKYAYTKILFDYISLLKNLSTN